jgi:ribose/xylose/arabinose/galactoside ABC-type transport system permease subunit
MTTAARSSTAPEARTRRWRRVDLANVGFAVAILAIVVFASVATDSFLTSRNIVSISRQLVTNGFLSLGMLVVVLTGGIDLSVGSILAFAGLLATGLQEQMPFPAAILVALLMGLAVGLLNGFLIARFRLQPFIVTLATMGSLRGLLYVYSATPKYPIDPLFRSLLGGGFIGPLPVPALLLLTAAPIVWFYLNHTTSGRAIYAIGVNQEAVRLAGIDVQRHLLAAYGVSGFLAALAGVLLASRLGIAQPSYGVGYELDAIAAVVIGGGILGGGGGTLIGVVGGVLALAMIDNVLNLFNVESYYQQFLKGLIILVAVLARRKRA